MPLQFSLIISLMMALSSPPALATDKPQVTLDLSSTIRCSSLLDPSGLETFLLQSLQQIAEGPQIAGYVGTLSELSELMEKAGMPAEVILKLSPLVRAIIANNRSADTILGRTVRQLEFARSKGHILTLCVLGEHCELKTAGAVHVAWNKKFDIVPFYKTDGRSRKIGWVRGDDKSDPKLEIMRIIMIPGRLGGSWMKWVSQLLHEATHFADFGLVSEWMERILKSSEPEVCPMNFSLIMYE